MGTISDNAFYGGSSGSFGGGLSGGGGSSKPLKPKYQNSSYKDAPVSQTVEKVKEAAEDFSEVMDYIAIAIERVTNEISIQESIANDLYQTFRNQNPVLEQTIAQTQEKLKFLQRAYDKYMLQADASGLSEEYKNKIKNGALDISTVTDENLKKQIDDYQKWYESALNVREEIVGIGSSLRDLNIQKLENIADDFERVISYKDSLYDMMDSLNALNELKGIATTADDLKKMMGVQTDIVGYYKGQAQDLQKEFDNLIKNNAIDKNNDDYWEWVTNIQKAQNDALEAEQAVYELKEQIFEIQFIKPFDKTIEQLDFLEKELDTLGELINENALFNEDGSMGNAGFAQLGIYTKQLSASKQRAAEYAKAIKELKKNLDNGNITQEKYNELLADYSSEQQQAAQDTKEAMDAIIELRVKGIEKSVEAYQKLIDIRKEDLSAQKEYKEQERQLNEKSDEINSVNAQIAAIQGDESQKQRLKQLLEQKSKLEQEYNDMVEENRYNAEMEGYDEAMKQFQEHADKEILEMQTNMEKQTAIITESLGIAKENYEEVFTYLSSVSDAYGLSLQTNIVDSWKNAENATNAYIEAVNKAQAQSGINSDKINVPTSKPTTTTPSKENSVDNIVNTPPVKQPDKKPDAGSNGNGSGADTSIWKGIKVNNSWKHSNKLNKDISIHDRIAWNGYQPSYASQKQLWSNLGGSGTYRGTASQNSWMVQQLKNRGFSSGGIGQIIKRSGEDGIAFVKNGEGFISPEHVPMIQKLLNTIPQLDSLADTMLTLPSVSSLNRNNGVSIQVHYDKLFDVQGDVTKDTLPKLETILNMAVDKTVKQLNSIATRPGFGGFKR